MAVLRSGGRRQRTGPLRCHAGSVIPPRIPDGLLDVAPQPLRRAANIEPHGAVGLASGPGRHVSGVLTTNSQRDSVPRSSEPFPGQRAKGKPSAMSLPSRQLPKARGGRFQERAVFGFAPGATAGTPQSHVLPHRIQAFKETQDETCRSFSSFGHERSSQPDIDQDQRRDPGPGSPGLVERGRVPPQERLLPGGPRERTAPVDCAAQHRSPAGTAAHTVSSARTDVHDACGPFWGSETNSDSAQ